MPDTNDPRVARSRAQLSEALRVLLRTREPSDISVSALCTEAGVSRPTFYQHFASLDDVAVVGIEDRLRRLRAELPEGDGPETSYRLLDAWLTELDAERESWQRSIAAFSASRDAVETWLVDQLAPRAPEATAPVLRYAAAGFLGAVRAWLLEDAGPERLSASELAASLSAVSARVLSPVVPPTEPASNS